jgi:hypothetical protein
MLMFSRAALLLCAQLLCALILAGCQNAPNQLSLYAPFGSPIVQPPSLTRVNAVPYYSPDNDKTAPNAAPTTASTTNKDLSHYDPYRGIMLPGSFTPPPVLARSAETWGNSDSLAASRPRERASNEEPIRIVESNSSPTNITAIASQGSGTRSGAVKFDASPPSGAVLPGSTLLATPTKPKTVNAVEMARLPKNTTATPITNSPAPTAPATTPAVNTPAVPALLNPTSAPLTIPPAATQPGLLSPPPLTTPVTPRPVGSNRVSSSDEPRDGKVTQATHFEEVDPSAWRVKR